ncbi:hypothetical protein V8E54_013027 [Elaphomyces granulatus]
MFFYPRKYRSHRAVLIMMLVEFPFILVVMILTGIASHDLYQTSLWQDGAYNGFNSAPNQVVYALTNGRPYSVPIVWSSFIINFDLVLGVLSAFILLGKLFMHILRLFVPPLSVILHAVLFSLFIVSTRYQAGSDMSDSRHPQPGPPWYITKNCNVAFSTSNIGYCQQAKSLFAVSVILSVIYFVEFVLALISCFNTKEERQEWLQRRAEKRAEKMAEEEILREYQEVLKSPAYAIPMTPASMMTSAAPVTPHSFAFSRLDGRPSDLPLRNHFSTPHPNAPYSIQETTVETGGPSQIQPLPYFPPPPKKAVTKR